MSPEDAKRIADKYVTRDGRPVTSVARGTSPVPKVRQGSRMIEQLDEIAEMARSKQPDELILDRVDEVAKMARRVYEEQKVAANEGRISHDSLERFRKNLDRIDQIRTKLRGRL